MIDFAIAQSVLKNTKSTLNYVNYSQYVFETWLSVCIHFVNIGTQLGITTSSIRKAGVNIALLIFMVGIYM